MRRTRLTTPAPRPHAHEACRVCRRSVRKSNALAIGMYTKMGYTIYRQVIGYYSGEEDAYDMRKPLSRDVDRKSAIPLTHPVHPDELD